MPEVQDEFRGEGTKVEMPLTVVKKPKKDSKSTRNQIAVGLEREKASVKDALGNKGEYMLE